MHKGVASPGESGSWGLLGEKEEEKEIEAQGPKAKALSERDCSVCIGMGVARRG